MGTSLFSLVRVRRFTVIARSFLGKFCLDSKQNSESGGGVLNLRKVLTQAQKYDCNCGEWSERLVIQNPTAAATEFCSQMCRLSMKLCSGPWATRVKIGAGCGLSRSALFSAQHYLIWSRVQAPASTAVFCWAGQVAFVPRSSEESSTPDKCRNQSISPVFSITYIRKMPQFAA